MVEQSGIPVNRAHFRPDIEGLRAIAVVAVLLYHIGLPGIPGGFVGVDVFYVISGFLITGLILREIDTTGRVDLVGFYARRMRRLLPAALLVVAFTIVVSSLVLSRLRFPSVAGDAVATALYVSNIRFALSATDYLASAAAPSPLLHTWSLSVEEQFYLVWPVLLFALSRLLSRRHVGWVLLGIAGASLMLSVVWTDVAAPWAFFSLPTRMWELAGGGLIAIGLVRLPARAGTGIATMAGGLGLVLLGAALVTIDAETPFPGTAALLPVGATMLLILAGGRPGALHARVLSMRIPRWLGRISYSLYLWHWPLLVLIPVWIGRDDLVIRGLLVLVAIVLATASTELIEVPIREQRALRAPARRSLVAALGATGTVAAIAVVMGVMGPLIRPTPPAVARVIEDATPAPSAIPSSVPATTPSPAAILVVTSAPTQVLSPARSVPPSPDVTPIVAPSVVATLLPVAVPSVAAPTPEPTPQAPQTPPTVAAPSVAVPSVAPTAPEPTPQTPPTVAAPSVAPPTPEPTPEPTPQTPLTVAGLLAGPIPADLRPTLEGARDDLPRGYMDGCHLDFAGVQAPACTYGTTDPASPLAMLIGDSHAAQWLPAVEQVAADRGWRLIAITKSGCPLVDVTVWNKPLKRAYRECDAWREEIATRIATERPAVLLVAASRGYQVVDDAGRHPFAESLPAWRAGLVRTLTDSVSHAGLVLLLADTPRLLEDPVECLAASGSLEACATSREALVDASYLELEAEVAQEAGASLIRTVDWLCDEMACPLVMADLLVYRDDQHLTGTFAASLAGLLGASVDRDMQDEAGVQPSGPPSEGTNP